MFRLRRPVRAALVLAAAAVLAACASAPSTPAAAPDGSGFPLTLTDANGPVTIPSRPLRVAALDQSYVDATIALEAQLVAYTTYRGVTDALPDYLGADALTTYAASAKPVGSLAEPNLEQIAAVGPDLIVSANVRHAALRDRFGQIAPTVFSETTGPTWKDNIRLLGRALGRSDLAEQKIGAYEDRARRLGEAVRAKLGRTPSVSLVRFTGEPTVRLYSATSYFGTVVGDAGFTLNPTAAAAPPGKINADVSQERLLELDADYVFVSTTVDGSGAAAAQAAQTEANPLWGRLTGRRTTVSDVTWLTAVGLQGANAIIDDMAATFGVTV